MRIPQQFFDDVFDRINEPWQKMTKLFIFNLQIFNEDVSKKD